MENRSYFLLYWKSFIYKHIHKYITANFFQPYGKLGEFFFILNISFPYYTIKILYNNAQDHMQINIHNTLKRINSSKAAEKGFISNKYEAHRAFRSQHKYKNQPKKYCMKPSLGKEFIASTFLIKLWDKIWNSYY